LPSARLPVNHWEGVGVRQRPLAAIEHLGGHAQHAQ
jgi:hypothetical protein